MESIILEIVKAALAGSLTLLAAWLQRRRDLRDLKNGTKKLKDFKS